MEMMDAVEFVGPANLDFPVTTACVVASYLATPVVKKAILRVVIQQLAKTVCALKIPFAAS